QERFNHSSSNRRNSISSTRNSPAATRRAPTTTIATWRKLSARVGWQSCGDDLFVRSADNVVTNTYQSAKSGVRHEERFQSDGFRYARDGALRSVAEIHRQEVPRSRAHRSQSP